MKIEKYNQNNKRKYTLITLGLLSVIGISLVIGSSFAKFSENQSFKIVEGNIDYYGDADVIFTYYDQNSEELDTMPTKESKLVFDYGSCDNEEEVTWDSESWGPVISNITNSKTRCSLYFKEDEAILRQIESVTGHSTDTQGMWGYKDKIIKIVIESSLIPKIGTVVYGPFDESSNSNNSIQSYVVCEEKDTNCIGYLQGNEKIKLNKDSSNLFEYFSQVITIEGMEKFDTSNVTDMSSMFSGMSILQELNLGNKINTSHVTDMRDMFNGMSSLKSLDLSQYNFDTSHVENMSSMFSSMYKLQELYLGINFDTSNVTDMSYMFQSMENLQELNLGNKFNTSSVTKTNYMFSGMKALRSLDLSKYNFDTSRVTNMSRMFSGMNSLQSLNLGSNFNTSNVTDMSYMFNGMSVLQELNLGEKFDTSSVKNMQSMFFEMSSLRNLDLSIYNFNTSSVTNMERMFCNMKALQSLNLGNNFNTSNVENMNAMFGSDTNLTTINYSSNFIHKEGASTVAMFGGKISNFTTYLDCPANQPNTDTHPSWEGVSFAGVE